LIVSQQLVVGRFHVQILVQHPSNTSIHRHTHTHTYTHTHTPTHACQLQPTSHIKCRTTCAMFSSIRSIFSPCIWIVSASCVKTCPRSAIVLSMLRIVSARSVTYVS
jgi:hypothetical protein